MWCQPKGGGKQVMEEQIQFSPLLEWSSSHLPEALAPNHFMAPMPQLPVQGISARHLPEASVVTLMEVDRKAKEGQPGLEPTKWIFTTIHESIVSSHLSFHTRWMVRCNT
ncbi:uncharacterized protein LOC144282446 [Canis aureus]